MAIRINTLTTNALTIATRSRMLFVDFLAFCADLCAHIVEFDGFTPLRHRMIHESKVRRVSYVIDDLCREWIQICAANSCRIPQGLITITVSEVYGDRPWLLMTYELLNQIWVRDYVSFRISRCRFVRFVRFSKIFSTHALPTTVALCAKGVFWKEFVARAAECWLRHHILGG